MSPGDALKLLETMTPVLPEERVPLMDASGRVLARPFAAPFDMPAFPRAAMDGYAIRAADIEGASADHPTTLRIAGDILAGKTAPTPLQPGHAYRIATGGEMPPGSDAVLRQEEVAESAAGSLTVTRSVPTGRDVVPIGANIRAGEHLLPAGWTLGANDLGLMAAFGETHAHVIRRPRIAYVETGDELIAPGETLPPGHIYGSNGLALAIRAQEHGADVIAHRRVSDHPESMAETFHELAELADIVVSTGGVSVGPKDLVPGILESMGFEQLFRGLPIRPGHPAMAAHRDGKLWIGLAGNPTAALVTHEFFVRPVLWRMAGFRFAQGFNPAWRAPIDGPPLPRRDRTSLYLGHLRVSGGTETVKVDRKRRPTALPAPFNFNAIVHVDPAPQPEGAPQPEEALQPEPDASTVSRVHVYPTDRIIAESRLTPFPLDVGGILLAGGESRRMGHSKLFLSLQGVPLIVRAYRALAEVCSRVRVIGAPVDVVDLLAMWEGDEVRAWCFPDEHPSQGPLAGLLTGLRHTSEPLALCLAADLPFVDGAALRALLEAARGLATSVHDDEALLAQGFVLAHGGERQPLAGLYPVQRSLSATQALWNEGGRAIHQLMARLTTHEVATDRSLANVNRPEDYKAAREALEPDASELDAPKPDALQPQADALQLDAPPLKAPALLAFSGYSGSGKTTLISRLIPLLKQRGFKVAVIKHGRGFDVDKPGKDSWRFKEAGADGVLLFSSEEIAYMARPATPPPFHDLVRRVRDDVDVILVEGFKAYPIPKVAVLRPDETWSEHPLATDPYIQAVYGGSFVAPFEEQSGGPFKESSGGRSGPGAAIPVFPRTEKESDDAALLWFLDWIVRRLAGQPPHKEA